MARFQASVPEFILQLHTNGQHIQQELDLVTFYHVAPLIACLTVASDLVF